MSEQNFGEHYNSSGIVERNNQATNTLVADADPFRDNDPVDEALVQETPMGGTVVAVEPVDEPPADEVPMYQTPLQEIPMGGTVAAVGPMGATLAHEFPMRETLPDPTPVVETVVNETRVDKPFSDDVPAVAAVVHEVQPVLSTGSLAALLSREESEQFRARWNEIQGKFVDEPRTAVQQADALVSEVSAQITQMFAKEHSSLEGQWKQGNDVSTEELRKALQRYRSFFNRLVV